ncbi:MAG: hypothetical protein KJN81_13040 [Acidimicrobiia bacterium]|nr:hypothetical protein [Acidimicrobiia bacterium]
MCDGIGGRRGLSRFFWEIPIIIDGEDSFTLQLSIDPTRPTDCRPGRKHQVRDQSDEPQRRLGEIEPQSEEPKPAADDGGCNRGLLRIPTVQECHERKYRQAEHDGDRGPEDCTEERCCYGGCDIATHDHQPNQEQGARHGSAPQSLYQPLEEGPGSGLLSYDPGLSVRFKHLL